MLHPTCPCTCNTFFANINLETTRLNIKAETNVREMGSSIFLFCGFAFEALTPKREESSNTSWIVDLTNGKFVCYSLSVGKVEFIALAYSSNAARSHLKKGWLRITSSFHAGCILTSSHLELCFWKCDEDKLTTTTKYFIFFFTAVKLHTVYFIQSLLYSFHFYCYAYKKSQG